MINVIVLPEIEAIDPYEVRIDNETNGLLALQRLVHGPIEQMDGALPAEYREAGDSILINEEGTFNPGMFLINEWAQKLGLGSILGNVVAYGITPQGHSRSVRPEFASWLTEGLLG